MSNDVVAKNKVVAITYTLRNERGEIAEIHQLPVAYVHGSGADLFPKIEWALEGKTLGDQVSVQLSPDEAFGAHNASLTYTDDLENVPPDLRKVGTEVEMKSDKGETRIFIVSKIEDGKLTVDGNHPLAGQNVTFEVKVVDIRDATKEEITKGRPANPYMPPLQ
jgi:FKBP-type peptidyl-prolyl cis-trans isomerase SlyD